MMVHISLHSLLLVSGFVLFVLAALNVPARWPSLGWAGMACVSAALFFT